MLFIKVINTIMIVKKLEELVDMTTLNIHFKERTGEAQSKMILGLFIKIMQMKAYA